MLSTFDPSYWVFMYDHSIVKQKLRSRKVSSNMLIEWPLSQRSTIYDTKKWHLPLFRLLRVLCITPQCNKGWGAWDVSSNESIQWELSQHTRRGPAIYICAAFWESYEWTTPQSNKRWGVRKVSLNVSIHWPLNQRRQGARKSAISTFVPPSESSSWSGSL